MPRIFYVVALAILLVPTAAASDPVLTLAVGPGGAVSTHKEEPYYLALDLGVPEAPGPADAADDCAYDPEAPRGHRPPPSVASKFIQWLSAGPNGSFASWFPTCAAVDVSAGADAYAAYNISSGRYYIDLPGVAPPGTTGFAVAGTGVSGTSGAGASADCLGCPTPP